MSEGVAVRGLAEDQSQTLLELLGTLKRKRSRNRLRSLYYDARRQPADLGMLLPPGVMQRVGTVLGWPGKAVDALAQRVAWQGFHVEDSGLQVEVDALAEANRLESELPQAFVAAMEHSVAFLAAEFRAGDERPVIFADDAMNGTGRWDHRQRRLTAYLSVAEWEDSEPSDVTLFLDDVIVHLVRDKSTWLKVSESPNMLGIVPAEMIPLRPRLGRPFGMSRITRPVMALTDMAVRTVLRSEVGAEFYSTPQRWLMGADEKAFGGDGDTWRMLLGRVMAMEDADAGGSDMERKNPRAEVGQFPQISMQPHMDQLRSLAQLFSGETGIPVSSLGISIDSNPVSADSYAASREDIIAEAEAVVRDWRGALSRIMGYAMVLDGLPVTGPILTQFRDPRYTSRSAAADAFVKITTQLPWMAQSDTAVELLGFDDVTTLRLKQDRRRAASSDLLAALDRLTPATPAAPDVEA